MIVPSPSMCFIIQDEKPTQTDSGIIIETKEKGKASHGTIYAINSTVTCPHCIQQFDRKDLKEGDRVLFSRYVTEQIEIDELKGKRVFAVFLDAILAKLDA